jgi:tetratricopeptide (TPR) repeat protein
MQSGKTDEAIERLKAINDLEPELANNHYNLGVAYSKKEDYENSIKSFKKAIKLNPKFSNSYYSIAVVEENYVITLADDSKNLKNPKIVEKILYLLDDANKNYYEYTKYPDSKNVSNLNDKFALIKEDIDKYNKIYEKVTNKDSSNSI